MENQQKLKSNPSFIPFFDFFIFNLNNFILVEGGRIDHGNYNELNLRKNSNNAYLKDIILQWHKNL